ncbi:DNA methyltransferase [Providencia rettgeri]|nr:DNA methyltransferase [Providencia rettgeri]QHP74774.1 DNA methyltransferase [Proteus vulgaris]UII02295.1 DNA methyltransferase [Providencia rettgeri]
MSREDYVKFGRSEMLRTVTAGELLKVTGMIGQPLSNYQ